MLFGSFLITASAVTAGAFIAVRKYVWFFGLLIALLFSQNIIAMLALRNDFVSVRNGDLLLLPKEVVLILAFGVASGLALTRIVLAGKIRLSRTETLIVLYLAFLAAQFLVSPVPFYPRTAGLRSLALLPLLYLTARWLPVKFSDVRQMFRLLIGLAVLVALFGLLEAYLLPPSFWLQLGHEEYYLMKVGRPIQEALYNNMRFWVPWSTEPVRRIASISGDPLISSYPLAFALCVFGAYVVYVRRINTAVALLSVPILVALLLTISRGAALTLLLALGLLIFFRHVGAFRLMVALGVIGAVAVVFVFGEGLLNVTYGRGHIVELQQGIERGVLNPLGLGLGLAGSVAAGILNASDNGSILAAGGDSFFGAVATQIGVVGLTFFVAVVLSISVGLYRNGLELLRDSRQVASWYLATAAFIGGLLITSTVNESGMGYVATGLIFFFAGALMKVSSETPVSMATETADAISG